MADRPQRKSLAEARQRKEAASADVVGARLDRDGYLMVDPTTLTPNPANPRGREVPDAGLVESIEELGILQPLVVVPVADWQGTPVEGAELIIVAGHRRRTAAVEAGIAQVPVIVRPQLGALGDEVMAAENSARAGLTPMEEARNFARQAAKGLTQSKIARTTGVSQGHVSKRLSLLQWPDVVLDAIDAGTVDVGDALRLIKEAKDDEVMTQLAEAWTEPTGWQTTLDRQLWNARDAVAKVRRAEAAAARAKELDVPVVVPQGSVWSYALHTDTEIEEARAAGTLAVAPGESGDGVLLISTTKKRSLNPEQDEIRLVQRSTKARKKWLDTYMPTATPGRDPHRLIRAALRQYSRDSDARKLAEAWATTAKLIKTPADWHWKGDLRVSAQKADHLVFLDEVASAHRAIASSHRRWDVDDAKFMRQLMDWGYTPTPHESEQLEKAEAAAAANTTTNDHHQEQA